MDRELSVGIYQFLFLGDLDYLTMIIIEVFDEVHALCKTAHVYYSFRTSDCLPGDDLTAYIGKNDSGILPELPAYRDRQLVGNRVWICRDNEGTITLNGEDVTTETMSSGMGL